MMTSSTPGNRSESDTYPANYQPHVAYLQSRLTERRHSLTPGHHASASGGSSSSGQSPTADTSSTPSKSTRIIRRGSLQPTSTAAFAAAAAAAGGGLTPRRRTGSIDTANAVRWSNDVNSKKPAADNSAATAAAAPVAATLQQQQQSADASELIDGFVKEVDEAAISGNRRPLPKPSGAFAAALGVSE